MAGAMAAIDRDDNSGRRFGGPEDAGYEEVRAQTCKKSGRLGARIWPAWLCTQHMQDQRGSTAW
eukprot:9079627-Pyramimonas_sp.AAC.1